jgi:hypothetical protein
MGTIADACSGGKVGCGETYIQRRLRRANTDRARRGMRCPFSFSFSLSLESEFDGGGGGLEMPCHSWRKASCHQRGLQITTVIQLYRSAVWKHGQREAVESSLLDVVLRAAEKENCTRMWSN